MFKRRDIPPVLLLLLLIILVMLTLSQILVVHNGRYGKNVHNLRKLQLELRQMDINLHTMMMQNVPSIELNRRLLQNSINSQKVAHIIAEAALPDRHFAPSARSRARVRTRPIGNHSCNGSVERRHHRSSTNWSRDYPPSSIVESSQAATGPAESELKNSSTHIDFQNGSRTVTSEAKVVTRKESVRLEVDNQSHLHSNLQQDPSPGGDSVAELGSQETRNGSGTEYSYYRPVFTNSTSHGYSKNQTETTALNISSIHVHRNQTTSSSKRSCPPVPPKIRGRIFIDFAHKHDYTEADIVAQNPELLEGGAWRPTDCVARHKVAIIIPYRDRKEHLTILLSHLHPMLRRQQLDYRIYVVEQYGDYTFNKARIMNIAFVEALKQYSFQCFVFHDVDLVPEDDRNMYSCPMQPRHMSVAIDEMGYKLAYQELVGGVLNMRTEHFQSVNGYSNLYWGWGAEDDDMAYRIMYVGLKITRPPESVARYKMIKHTKRKPSDWRKRAKLLYTGTRRFQFDGLNSLKYKLLSIENNPLFTHILVDIGKPPKGF